MNNGWDQSRFDVALERYLNRLSAETWPRAINKKAFFVTLRAFQNTPATGGTRIKSELQALVSANVLDSKGNIRGRSEVMMQYIIAAKRAGKHWTKSKRFARQAMREAQGKATNYKKAWLANLRQANKSLVGGRMASTHFMQSGYLPILKNLGRLVGGRYARGPAAFRGDPKGTVTPASAQNLTATIINHAQSKSALWRGKLIETVGMSALQEAIDYEAAQMEKYLDDEMRAETEKFNSDQH